MRPPVAGFTLYEAVPPPTAPASGHILRVTVRGDHVVLDVECHEAAAADCRTADGGCLVAEQADAESGFAEYHEGPDEPLADGMRIAAWWSAPDECYTWHAWVDTP